jgi:hypothetical protein
MDGTRKLIGAFLLCALALAVLAGCGGSDSSTTASEPLTKTQFIKRATGLCKKVFDEIEPRMEEAAGKNFFSASRRKQVRLTVEVVIPFYQEVIAEFADLEPPAGDKAAAGLIDEAEAKLKQSEAKPTLLMDADPFESFDLAAQRYGIEGCIF